MKYPALFLVTMVLTLIGCEKIETPASDIKGKVIISGGFRVPHAEWKPTDRFSIEYQQSFWAGFGDNIRSVLILTDKKTGRQYVAITGCGVSELRTETVHSGETTTTRTAEE